MTFSTFASPGVSLQGGGGSSGGGGTPGGSNTQIQYNNSGAFAGASGLTTNGTELTIASGTKTADAPVLNMSQTWNNGAVTFTGLKFNAAGTSDANSAAASLLMDLQVGGASRFNVSKAGRISGATGVYAPYVDLGGPTNGPVQIGRADQGNILGIGYGNTGALTLRSDAAFGWSNSDTVTGASMDPATILTRRGTANLRFGAADVGATTATVTITIAAPGVVTWSSHTLSTGTPVVFTTTGALPTGIVSGTTYYAVVVNANTFQIASSVANAIAATPTVITTSGTQSGTHTGTRYNITQRLSMQSITGVTDRIGADLFIQGSQGTGTGAGGSIIFQVAPAGSSGTAQNALATALTIASTTDVTFAANAVITGKFFINADLTGNDYFFGSNFYARTTVRLASGTPLGWSSSATSPNAAADLILTRDAANTLALRNGTNAQLFRVYSTYNGTNDAYGAIGAAVNLDGTAGDANTLYIGSQKKGSPTALTKLAIQVDGTTRMDYGVTTASTWYTASAFSAGAITASVGGGLNINARSYITSDADGNFTLFNLAGSSFGLLKFGGTDANFPALKRVSANLQVIAADGTSSAGLIVGNQALATTATDGFLYVPTCAGTPTGTPTAQTGTVPIVVDTTANKLYFYSTGQWRDAGP